MRLASARSVLLALALLTACQDDAARMQEHLERGESYMEDERFREAIIEFKSALQLDPNDAQVHYRLAHAYMRTNKAREGFWELRETVRLDPTHHDAKLEFSQLAIIAGEKEEALKLSSEVVEADPENTLAYLVRGQALDSLDRRDEALASYAQAVEVGPEATNALQVYAKALVQRQKIEEAEEILHRLVEVEANFPNYSLLARFLRQFGPERRDDQDAAFVKATELAEGDERPRAIGQLASWYVATERLDQAFALLEKAREEEEDKLQLIYFLARLYRTQGDLEKADALVESTAEAAPDDAEVFLVLSAYRARNGDWDGALAAAQKGVELAPDLDRAKLQQAEILMELGFKGEREGAVEQARALIQGILAAEPSHPKALFADAKLKLGEGDVAGATGSLRASVEARPNWAEAHYLLGVALAVQEDFPAARRELGQALELDTALLDAKNVLAQVHFKLGEWEYCVERGRQYLREKPDANRTRLIVAQSLIRLGRVEDARAELTRIPEAERDEEILYAMGRIEQATGNREGAREYLVAADEVKPHQYDIVLALLRLDRADGRLDESKARIDAAIAAEPENAKLYQVAGLVALLEGRGDDAEADYQKAIELDPYDLAAYESLGRYYARTGRLEETARTYEQALEVKPDAAQLHHFLGVLYELSGDQDRAIQRYEEAIRHGPQMAEAKNNLAYIYAEREENLDRALDLAQEAKQQLPEAPSVADTLGWVLYKRNVPSAAIAYLKEAEAGTRADDASLGVVVYHLAQAYEANEEPDEAIGALDRSLETLAGQRKAVQEQGDDAGAEPEWAAEARAMRDRLEKAQTAQAP